jgi:hypothetical protein
MKTVLKRIDLIIYGLILGGLLGLVIHNILKHGIHSM